jgi:hypothetical protein
LFIHQEKNILSLVFQRTQGKNFLKNQNKLVQNSKNSPKVTKKKKSPDLALSPPIYTNS